MRIIDETSELVAPSKLGKTKHWKCRVVTDNTDFYLVSEAWTTDSNGGKSKPLISEPAKVEGKNVGKSNATTDKEQAVLEMKVKERKKLDSGYCIKGKSAVRTYTLPMLAISMAKRQSAVKFPMAVQPKYNGIRCLYNSEIGHWSRQGKPLIAEVMAHLHFDTMGYTVDGELILPQEYTFQQTISAIKKFDPIISPKLLYRLYDVVADKPFRERWDIVEKIRKAAKCKSLVPTITEEVNCVDELADFHRKVTGQGFEGTMLRNWGGTYQAGHRSEYLLKFKEMQDDEFEIIGFEDGVGRDAGAIIFHCKTKAGKEFKVRPEGTLDERANMFKRGKSYIGHKLTVRYQTLSDDGVPIFPVGVVVRDYE